MLKTIIFLMLIVHCSTEEDMTLSNAQIDFKSFILHRRKISIDIHHYIQIKLWYLFAIAH